MSARRTGLPRDTRLLLGTRAARSVGQGALIVAFALYLDALGWGAPAIGALFTAGLLFDAVLVIASGPLSDRFGRKRFLLCYECVQVVAALLALSTAATPLLVLAALFGGFGRGANGSSGPFAPVELAWLSQPLAASARGSVYSLNMALGFGGMGLGALLAATPTLFSTWLPGALSFRPLFGLVLIGALTCLLLISLARDRPPIFSTDSAQSVQDDHDDNRRENSLLLRLMGINALNGVAIGLVGPLMAYWFALRFGQGPEDIGPVMALAYGVTAVSSIGAGRLVRRTGVVRAVVWMRSLGLVMLLLLPFMPSFWMAAVLHIARSALNRGSAGARQALTVSLVRPHRRGTAASTGSAAIQLPRAAGPLFAGLFFGAGYLATPFYIAAGFFAAYIYCYQRTFKAYDPNRNFPA
ncbi:MFS transporter [Salinisphaera aquimarina]|uniref:MFS transporter n=1 Tax=Salinisphaera aquimarina TaxID=2094031 RepID=A0ABV7ETF9_9GAMM